jgi:hypothetical protein
VTAAQLVGELLNSVLELEKPLPKEVVDTKD